MSESRDRWFEIRYSGTDLRRRVVVGIAYSSASRAATHVIGLVSLMVLARLLTPGDFGLVAMAAVLVGLADVVRDAGLTTAIVRHADLNAAQASNIFWLNLALTASMLVLALILSPWVDSELGAGVGGVVIGMLAAALVGAAGQQHLGLIRRALRFDLAMKASVYSRSLSSLVAVAAAFAGAGYWSLVWGALAGEMASSAVAWRYCGWRPTRPRRGVGTRPLLDYGVRMLGFNLMAYAATNLHTLLIGRMLSAPAAGLYARAFGVHRQFREWVVAAPRQVMPAALARAASDPEAVAAYYYRGTSLLVIAGCGISFVCIVLPRELILTLFGARWEDAVELVRILAYGVVAQFICASTGWIYSSVGDVRRMIRWGFVGWGAMILGVATAAPFLDDHGPAAMAWAASLSIILITVPCVRYAFRGTSLRGSVLARHLAAPMTASLLSALATAWLLQLASALPAPVRLLTGTGVFLAMQFGLLMLVPGSREMLLGQLRALTDSIAQRRGAA